MLIANKNIAIQDTYGDKFQHCYGCGPQNHHGLHLKTYPSLDGYHCVSTYTPDNQYTGGVPENVFGGMIAMLFDCHGTASAAWFAHQAKGHELTRDTVIGRYITARLEIDFKKPLPINEEVTIISEMEEITERKVIVLMNMEAAGEIRAIARMIAVAVKDTM
ncbi:thioesterase [Tuanshanicoccus lijuaniae]|uniref:thioesterase n=1 Tax=Aerococcaceae bacterium zg-1292 TaxID=2774330 RepID=UPI001938EFF8|nr:thioesterase [Aerococcaceae bacterium zg-1292]QQA36304.1 thioesterase [Aerococcaceae bacterium zg-1292]